MKLSVAMITYNHERFLRQALESVLAQRVNFGYEIVVGEDCSTDGTRAILMDFYRRYPDRIVPLLRDRNVGMMRNLRDTLNRCRGTYLALLEGDDYWTSEYKLQRQVDCLERNPDYAICCHRAEMLDETRTVKEGVVPSAEFAAGPYTVEDLIAGNFIYTCTAMYRWGSVGILPEWFFNLKLGDWPLHILVAQSGKIRLLDEVMAVYRVHASGVWSTKPLIERLEESSRMLKAVDRHLKFQYARPISHTLAVHAESLAILHFQIALQERRNGDRGATMRHLLACVRAGKTRLPGRFIQWASLLGYGALGVRRLRYWKQFNPDNS